MDISNCSYILQSNHLQASTVVAAYVVSDITITL
jgi:hypothetical protein